MAKTATQELFRIANISNYVKQLCFYVNFRAVLNSTHSRQGKRNSFLHQRKAKKENQSILFDVNSLQSITYVIAGMHALLVCDL